MTTAKRTRPALSGRQLLRDPRWNRGTAFTLEEREALGLTGLLPPGVLTLDQQMKRSYEQYKAQPNDLARNVFLAALHDRNEVLYYFPLSNPTERIEAVPADVVEWTEGRGLLGTGTPWEPVTYKGVSYEIGQANNALVYPGIGLGTIVAGATDVTDGMLLAAADAIAGQVDADRPGAGLLPDVENLRTSSATVAVAVARQAAEDGVAPELRDPVDAVQGAMWQARYPPGDALM